MPGNGWSVTLLLSVENPQSQIQVSGKGDPEGIGDLQIGGEGRYSLVAKDGADNQVEKNQEPDKGEEEPAEIKKENAPEEVENQAQGVVSSAAGGRGQILFPVFRNQRPADPHQDIKDGPDHGKKPAGGRKWRCDKIVVDIHTVHSQK